MMGWLGMALARDGYLVIAVDHPGNNGADEMTLAGSMLSWLRADDLRAALAAVQADPILGPHVDPERLGVVGFSAGGYTALLAAGARPSLQRLLAFCTAHPDDGVCQPQQEAATHTMQARRAAAASPALAPGSPRLTHSARFPACVPCSCWHPPSCRRSRPRSCPRCGSRYRSCWGRRHRRATGDQW